jgi:hypothetical protein
MSIRRWCAAGILLVLASCAAPTLPPVAVIATPGDAQNLAGNWEGEYSSVETRRSGKIQFFLNTESDSAGGEVLMFPSRTMPSTGNTGHVAATQEPQHLSIRMVLAEGDSVIGYLSPYEDFDGSTLVTRFAGVLKDDTMTGRYFTRNLRTDEITDGEWSLWRKRP